MSVRLQTFAVLAAFAWLAHPLAARSGMYQWTDEKGGVVYSNIHPRDTSQLRNFKVVMQDEPAPPPSAARAQRPPDLAAREAQLAAQAEALRHEQALQQRVASLEREIQALQYSSPPQSDAYAGAGYGASWDYPNSYGYPYSYAPPYVIAYSVIAPGFRSRAFAPLRVPHRVPVHTVPFPRTVPINGGFHGGAFHGGAFHGSGFRGGGRGR